jgi:hypothetical protein
LFSEISQIEESYKSKEDAHVRVGTLLVQSSLGVWEMPGKRRRSDCPRFYFTKKYIEGYNMGTIFIIAIVIIIIAVYIHQVKIKREEDELRGVMIEGRINDVSDFSPTKKVIGFNNLYTFAIDENKRKVAYFDEEQETFISYEEIISVDLIENNTTVASKSTMRTIGGAVVGGALGGGAGAVVGGLSGNTNMKKKVSLIQVRLRIRDISMPTLLINCFDCKTMTNGEDIKTDGISGLIYNQCIQHANQIVDLVSVIIDDVDKKEKKSMSTSMGNSSVAEELSKLADLKDKGILTEEEFSVQKAKLLS